jgi:hypothetical protein
MPVMSNFLNSISLFTTRRVDAAPQATTAQATAVAGGDGVSNTPKATSQPTSIDESNSRQTPQRSSKRGRAGAGENSERVTADDAQGPSEGLLPLVAYPVLREEVTPPKARQSRALNLPRTSTSVALAGTLTSASHPREPRLTGPVLTGAERIRLQVMQVQLRLASLSLYEGPIDGILSPETVTGVRYFQTLKGMRDTGALAAGTLSALGVPPID